MRSAETPTTRITLRDDGVLEARGVNPAIPRTAETVRVVMDTLAEVAGEDRRPTLWDVRDLSTGSPESTAAFLGRLVESVSALGLLVGKRVDEEFSSRVEAFSPAVDALLVPVRVFHEEAEAVAWLQGFVAPE